MNVTAPEGRSRLHRFMGGSPAEVTIRLVLLSMLVGALMVGLGLTPESLFRGIAHLIEALGRLSFDYVWEFARMILNGAVLVVPIWLVSRVFASKRPLARPHQAPHGDAYAPHPGTDHRPY